MPTPSLERWQRLWSRVGATGTGSDVWTELVHRYREPHRAYHNLVHIRHCLAEFDTVRPLAKAPDAVELAIWFHDAVYDTRAKDNEEKSAEMAVAALRSAGSSAELAAAVSDLVLATKHAAPPVSSDAALLVDIDLGILGQARERYEVFETEIRAEYSWVAPSDFAAGRGAILRGFLDRPQIYRTENLRTRWETSARQNLSWALSRLSALS